MTHESPGLVSIQSGNSVKVTIDRLEAMLKNKGIAVFARIDHAAAAAAVGMPLRPTELLIFGDPRAGTPLMQADQTIGIDLPLKALAWEDEDGRTWLSYNRPDYLAQRHGVHDRGPAVQAMSAGLEALARAAAGAQEAPKRPVE